MGVAGMQPANGATRCVPTAHIYFQMIYLPTFCA